MFFLRRTSRAANNASICDVFYFFSCSSLSKNEPNTVFTAGFWFPIKNIVFTILCHLKNGKARWFCSLFVTFSPQPTTALNCKNASFCDVFCTFFLFSSIAQNSKNLTQQQNFGQSSISFHEDPKGSQNSKKWSYPAPYAMTEQKRSQGLPLPKLKLT